MALQMRKEYLPRFALLLPERHTCAALVQFAFSYPTSSATPTSARRTSPATTSASKNDNTRSACLRILKDAEDSKPRGAQHQSVERLHQGPAASAADGRLRQATIKPVAARHDCFDGFSCARLGAVVKMKLEDVYEEDGHLLVRLNEKFDNRHYVPCHPDLEAYVSEFLTRASAPSDECDPNPAGWLFRRWDKKRKVPTGRPLTRLVSYRMVKRHTKALDMAKVTNHSFCATGITTFLYAGDALDDARRRANHASVNTTKVYDHRGQKVSMDDVLKINYRKTPVRRTQACLVVG